MCREPKKVEKHCSRGSRGGKRKCHMNFYGVLSSDFKAFGSKELCFREQNQGGGGQKSAKKCRVLLEWPLIQTF